MWRFWQFCLILKTLFSCPPTATTRLWKKINQSLKMHLAEPYNGANYIYGTWLDCAFHHFFAYSVLSIKMKCLQLQTSKLLALFVLLFSQALSWLAPESNVWSSWRPIPISWLAPGSNAWSSWRPIPIRGMQSDTLVNINRLGTIHWIASSQKV